MLARLIFKSAFCFKSVGCFITMIVFIVFNIYFNPYLVNGDCSISTNLDMGSLTPLMLRPGTRTPSGNHPFYLPATQEGDVFFNSDQEIILHCPGSQIQVDHEVIPSGVLVVACKSHRSFQVYPGGKRLPFKYFQCTAPPKHHLRRTSEKCTGGNDLLEIGFQLNDGMFIVQIIVCFDTTKKRTLFTKFDLSSSILGFQTHVPRQQFDEGGSIFNLGVPVEQCYYIPRQRETINQQLQLPSQSYKHIDRMTTIFTRGHLAAKADFVYGPQQMATFYWVNVAPQWALLNNGNWNELEKSVRYYAAMTRRDLVVYTGTLDFASVGNVDLFLHCDDENHIPVPKYFWKVVYEPNTKSGVAFISLNNPYIAIEEPFCKDICSELQWQLTWNPRDVQSFCCDVNNFRNYVNFPMFTVSTLLNMQ